MKTITLLHSVRNILTFEELEPENVWHFLFDKWLKRLIDHDHSCRFIFCWLTTCFSSTPEQSKSKWNSVAMLLYVTIQSRSALAVIFLLSSSLWCHYRKTPCGVNTGQRHWSQHHRDSLNMILACFFWAHLSPVRCLCFSAEANPSRGGTHRRTGSCKLGCRLHSFLNLSNKDFDALPCHFLMMYPELG